MKLIDARNAQGVLRTLESSNRRLDKLIERAEMVGKWLHAQQGNESYVMEAKYLQIDMMIFNEMCGNVRNIVKVNCVDKTIKKVQVRYSGLGDEERTEAIDKLTHGEFIEWFANTSKEQLYPLPLPKIGRVIRIKGNENKEHRDCLIIGSFNGGIKYVLLDLTTNTECGSYESLEKIEQLEIVDMWSSPKEYWTC